MPAWHGEGCGMKNEIVVGLDDWPSGKAALIGQLSRPKPWCRTTSRARSCYDGVVRGAVLDSGPTESWEDDPTSE